MLQANSEMKLSRVNNHDIEDEIGKDNSTGTSINAINKVEELINLMDLRSLGEILELESRYKDQSIKMS